METTIGNSLHDFAKKLWPINRSLTGNGVRETLRAIKEYLPELQIYEVPSGTKVFDWTIPNEWNVTEAWIESSDGNKFVDFKENNLHLVGYSVPVDTTLELEELQKHLHSLPHQPTAIPYLTSYYSPRWGFCLKHEDRLKLKPGKYRVKIAATLAPGSMTYGEILLKGKSEKEVFLSTYICHPSMANNELSGPCVTTFLCKWLKEQVELRYSYRVVFIPETIGSITYLSRNLDIMKKNVIAGFNITCVGDERAYSYLPSRKGDSLSDKAALHVLKHVAGDFKRYSFLDRGSDERQYCAPGVDLPVASITRSMYAKFPEYHTSLDDLNFVTPKGLEGGFKVLQKSIEVIENMRTPRLTVLCEPQLGKRGLYPTLSTRDTIDEVRTMSDLLAYSDGTQSLLEIADIIRVPVWELWPIYKKLSEHGLLLDVGG